jgi:hypothetical protein
MDLLCGCLLRGGLGILILVLLLENPIGVFAQNPPAPVCQASHLSLVGKGEEGKDFLFEMGDSLQIKATHECLQAMGMELKTAAAASKFKLFLDNVGMAGLPMNASEIAGQPEILLTFYLARMSEDKDNREAWDALLGKRHWTYESTLPIALSVGDQPAWGVQSASSVKFRLAKNELVWMTFVAGIAIFLVVYYRLVKDPSALRGTPNGPYSLGKSQMVFWGLLVVLTFAGIWVLTGTMERIPAQVLILIGISGATGLSAIVISQNKDETTQLQMEQVQLEHLKQADSGTFPPKSEARLNEIKARLATLPQVPASSGFWKDICDDGNGMSFHRLQVVIWTVVLGVIFLDSVAEAISMPEFSDTLLALQGMSNGTYLGFKIPEKT